MCRSLRSLRPGQEGVKPRLRPRNTHCPQLSLLSGASVGLTQNFYLPGTETGHMLFTRKERKGTKVYYTQ